ncbi:hypothetical protein H6F86_00380 [Phormidium sp. FACHB-592]|uniref:Uncharacterized protein n=1 Tax=Stenomitos frigidus AS-A4 TaxID=2933935 RepID=A0ABV0KSX6_9CYAN|nr:hypothetical protein [Phormidium sp. FACHB-592]MBD2072390.1 hypothetical protein [Phormidium sp. FACHB-592]
MNKRQAAKNLIDAAIRYQVYKLALQIAALPDDQISASAPAIKQLKEIAADLEDPSESTAQSEI